MRLSILLSATASLCVFGSTNFTEVYENESNFQAYLTSSFGQNAISDTTEIIADYLNDLTTLVLNIYGLDLTLSFQRHHSSRRASIFAYKPKVPIYHMKQNFKHVLHYPGLSGSGKLKLTFQRRAGDCAGGVQVFKRIGVSVRTINLDTSGDGIIKLVVDRDIQGAILTMDVPDNCTLYLTKVARSVVVEHRNQVRYSHRNNRPAELRGLFSTTIQNLDRYIFVTSARRLKWGVLENYNDTHAEFVWTPKSTTVIPEAKVFNAFELQRHLRFDQDTVVMKFYRPDRPKCHRMPSLARSSFEEIDARRHIQLSFEKHLLQANGRNLSFRTLRNCELKFVSISRTISINSDQILRKIIRYGMTQELMKETRLRVGLDIFDFPLSRREYRYIETPSELPPLPFK